MTSDLKSALSSLQGFNTLSEPVLEQLLSFVSTRMVRAGETIFCQGEPSPFCFGILSGEIVIQHVSKDHRFPPKVLNFLGPGSLFGESAIFEKSPRVAMATAGKDGKLAVIRGQLLREWISRHPEAGQPLLLTLLQSSLGRLHTTSTELALVSGVGRLLGSDKPFIEQLALLLEFLKGSLKGLDDMVFYRRSVYRDGFFPLMSVPALPDLFPIPLGTEIVQKVNEAGVPQSFDPKNLAGSLADLNLPWSTKAAMMVIPLFDWDKCQEPLQGLLFLAGGQDPHAFSVERRLLFTSIALPLAEALSRCGREEDLTTQDRLQQLKNSLPR